MGENLILYFLLFFKNINDILVYLFYFFVSINLFGIMCYNDYFIRFLEFNNDF